MIDDQLFKCLGKTLRKYPNHNLAHAFTTGQIDSKLWLTRELENLNISNKRTWLMCGWYGVLAYFLLRKGIANSVYLFDKDPEAVKISEELLKNWIIDNWKFKATCIDILDIDYANWQFSTPRNDGSLVNLTARPELIVNTSCEHIEDWPKWWRKIRKNTTLALQTNNYHSHSDHCNTVNSLDEWRELLRMGEIWYEGTMGLPDYERYMIIGKK